MIGTGLVALLALGLNMGTASAGPVAATSSTPLPSPQGTASPAPVHSPVYHTHGNTEFAQGEWYSASGYTYLQVARTSNTDAYLAFYTYDYATYNYECAYG